jgi:GlpG protein
MRLIGILEDEKKGLTFSSFLHQKGIIHQLEMEPNHDWGSDDYGTSQCKIWIENEDQVDLAIAWLNEFKLNPQDPLFHFVQSPPPLPSSDPLEEEVTPSTKKRVEKWENMPMGSMTRFFLILCSMLFVATQLFKSSLDVTPDATTISFISSPVEQALLYDYPHFYELINQFIHIYGFEGLNNPSHLSPEGEKFIQKIHQTPFWQGIYESISKVGFINTLEGNFKAPLFEKIREGEIWRFFTPALLHGDIFHIFFNMLWLMVLGKQIEQRVKASRYVLFIVLIGIFSNTAQYLMSGSNFVGFSGILCGMLTFIWVRQNQTPWEGYQLDRLTFSFMMFFILGMALLQVLSFVLELFFQIDIAPNIANTAHLSGAFIGLLFGRLEFFSWRHS